MTGTMEVKKETMKSLANELTGVLFYLCICCYSEDKKIQDKVMMHATAVRNAIDFLEKEADELDGGA